MELNAEFISEKGIVELKVVDKDIHIHHSAILDTDNFLPLETKENNNFDWISDGNNTHFYSKSEKIFIERFYHMAGELIHKEG